MLNRLRSHLSSISADQFQTEWAEIEAMGFEGISVEEFLKTLRQTPAISHILPEDIFASDVSEVYNATPVNNCFLAMAA